MTRRFVKSTPRAWSYAGITAVLVLLSAVGAGQAHETEGPLEEDTTLALFMGWCMLPTNATAPREASAPHAGRGDEATAGQPLMDCSLPIPPNAIREAPAAQREALYLLHMVHHHLSALDMAREAEQRAERPEVRDLARAIREDQGAEIERMTGWLREWHGLEAPRNLNETRLGMAMHARHATASTEGAASYDERFLRGMIAHHQEAIATSDALVAAGAPHEEAVALARDISSNQQEENGRMRMLLQQMGAAPEEPQEARGGDEGRGTPGIGAVGAALAVAAAAVLLAMRRRAR